MAFAQRLSAALSLYALGAALLFATTAFSADQPAPEAKTGVLDLRSADLSKEVVELRGEWKFFPNRFVDPAQPLLISDAAIAKVPGHWNAVAGAAEGYGTYALEVNCTTAPGLAMRLAPQRSAMRLFVNGREIAHQGAPGTTAETAQAAVVGQLAELGNATCPLRITAQVSNFNHRQGGLVRAFELGPEPAVRARYEAAFAFGVALVAGFVVMALLPLLFFATRPKERPPLWFGLFCLSLALFMALARDGVLHLIFAAPSWEPYLKAEYLAWYWASVLFLLFMRSIYPDYLKAGAVKAFVGIGIAVAAFVLLTPARIFTQALPLMQFVAVATGAYMTYATALAARDRRNGAKLLLGALAVFLSAEVVDLLQAAAPLRTTILPFASLLFAFAPAAVLIGRYGRALNREEVRLLEQRQRTEMLVRATKAGFLDWDAERGTTEYSDRFKEMLGYPPDADASAWGDYFSLVHPDDLGYLRTRFYEQLKDVSAPNTQRNMEPHDFRMHRADGSVIWVHAEAILLTGPDGKTLRHVCSFIDITERKRYEAEMSDRVKFVDDLFESVPIALAMRDPQGIFRYVNRTWENLVGYQREDVVGKTLFDIFPKEQAESRLALDREALERGPGSILEGVDRMLGERRLTQTRTVMADSQGALLGVITASLDTTDRFATEQALATEQRRLDLVVRAAKAGIVDWDGKTHATYYSPRFREIRGYAADTDTSDWPDYFKVMIHPDDRARVTKRFRNYIMAKGPEGPLEYYEPEEYRLSRADGSYVWVLVMGLCVRDENRFVTRFIASITDISQRREQEQALLFEQERLALLVRATRAGFMDWNALNGEMRYSERFKEMLGYARDADTSAWPTLFDMMHPEDRDFQREAFREMLRRGAETGEREHGPLEYRLRHADGSYIWVRGEGISRLDEEGRTARFLTSYIDITGLRKMNEALQESVRLREEVERIARHDLKTPLNSIVAAARLLREERAPTQGEAELLDVVERAGYRVLSMVNLSFDIFRMERGEYRFQPQAVNLSRLIERIAADLRIHAVSKGVGLRLPPQGPPVHAWADELLCYSILANLLKNAIEASPDSAAVTVSLVPDGTHVAMSLHNVGEVPPAVRAHFFEKYSTSGKSGGLGLGTYSARLLARVQQGDISLKTSAAEGTTLEIRLLALPAGLNPPVEADDAGVPSSMPALVLPECKVLVVDDDEYNLLVMRRYLPTPPLTVRTEANGRAAVDALETFDADVVFMDLEMPVMDGYAAVTRIREREKETGRKPASIVAFSSHEDEESKRRSLAVGCNLYLKKPAAREAVHRVLLAFTGHAVPAGDAASPGSPAPFPAGPADLVAIDADLRDTVPEFLRTRREAIAQMAGALRNGDPATLKRLAHKLSGSFALYGFRWASDQCRAIETGTEGASRQPSQIEELGQHLDRVRIRYSDEAPVAAPVSDPRQDRKLVRGEDAA